MCSISTRLQMICGRVPSGILPFVIFLCGYAHSPGLPSARKTNFSVLRELRIIPRRIMYSIFPEIHMSNYKECILQCILLTTNQIKSVPTWDRLFFCFYKLSEFSLLCNIIESFDGFFPNECVSTVIYTKQGSG